LAGTFITQKTAEILHFKQDSLMAAETTIPATPRLQSLDVLRGLNIFVMLFVNDLAGVFGAPGWMKHVSPPSADGMTFVDVVFPAFLFIAGLALPLALERRFARGDSTLAVFRHLLSRTLTLLLLGVFMVNSESISAAGRLDPRLWTLLLYAGICLIWIAPSASSRKIMLWRRIAGTALLLALALLFRGEGEPGLIELRPQWWGILGLIGWAYLVTGVLYLFLRKNRLGFAAAVVLLYCLYFADAAHFFDALSGISRWVDIGSMLGSHAAVTASGALLGMTLLSPAPHKSRIASALLFAGVLAAAAVLLHSLNGIHRMFFYNKIAATPPWCLLSSAWTALIWAAVYWLIEVKQVKFAAGVVAAAGKNALFAFILGPIVYTLLEWLPALLGGFSPWGWLSVTFSIGLFRSITFAAAALWLTAWLQRRGLTLRI
jgi:heparan-alpha-glucosaminide N-acetyltransferase